MADHRHVLTSRSRRSDRKNSERRLWVHLNDDWIHSFVEFVMRKNPSTSHSIHVLSCSSFPKHTERNEWKKNPPHLNLILLSSARCLNWFIHFQHNFFFSLPKHQSMLENISFWHLFFFLSLLLIIVGINLFLSLMEFYNVLTKSCGGWKRFNITIFDGAILTIPFNWL